MFFVIFLVSALLSKKVYLSLKHRVTVGCKVARSSLNTWIFRFCKVLVYWTVTPQVLGGEKVYLNINHWKILGLYDFRDFKRCLDTRPLF